MSFDPHSFERLRELSRQLPQELPIPNSPKKAKTQTRSKRHPIETEENPQDLFHELMKASPDGKVPQHLMNRLKRTELNQLAQSNLNNTTSKVTRSESNINISSQVNSTQKEEEDSLYLSFERLLLENEEDEI